MLVPSSADRVAPPRVAPVEQGGVRYAQAEVGREVGADRADGVLVATDIASGRRLWTLSVYRTPRQPGLEEDVQWRFFASMAFDDDDGRLRVVNEAGEVFLVDVVRRVVDAVG